jgi:hypothetical protein
MRVRSRAGADDALMRGMFASATRSLRNAIDGTCTGRVYRYMMHACIYIHARSYTGERIADAGPPHTHAHVLRPCARARVCVCDWAPTHPRRPCERVRSAWTACGSAGRRSSRRRRSARTSARGMYYVLPLTLMRSTAPALRTASSAACTTTGGPHCKRRTRLGARCQQCARRRLRAPRHRRPRRGMHACRSV